MHVLATDGYKFSMAEAGWPLRREVFYYAHRKGGPAKVPFDARAELEKLFPAATPADYAYLSTNEYEMGGAFKAAIARRAEVSIRALPKGAWFLPREPVFSLAGPSALVSWFEPLALQLHYRIQVASLATLDPAALGEEVRVVTCSEERDLVREALDAAGVAAPEIDVDGEGYFARVRASARELVSIVGDPGRIFEVGLRAASCVAQHRIALQACQAEGIRRTSHVGLAQELRMIPVGTMGHEHVQRFGSDAAAFRAMRDRRPGRSSYLLDTFDTIRSGIPAAFELMAEEAHRRDSIRYDSGDKEAQYLAATEEAKRRGLRPIQILEDGFDAAQTRRFEELRIAAEWAPEEQFYGYGGHLVAKTAATRLTRDRVAAVFKLSQTAASPTMKFGDERGSGKESVPGEPVVFRRVSGSGAGGVIGQAGERPPAGYVALTDGEAVPAPVDTRVDLSAATHALVADLRAKRTALLRDDTHPERPREGA
jgi:nicotinate phosphoribosyltransferase